jgi:hypothetical protein
MGLAPPSGGWERGVLLPACRERELLPGALESLAALPWRTVAAVVVNSREGADTETLEDNAETLDHLLSLPGKEISPGLHQLRMDGLDILLLDRTSEGRRLGRKQGVGIARHLGGGILCGLVSDGHLSCPWIWSTDADARFGPDYLDPLPPEAGTCVLPYAHRPASEALQIYELGLRHYALGLASAGSPYAFPTIGSTIAIRADIYQGTGGFPDRMAGEDFYLLNKAAKVAPLHYADRSPVVLVDRPSDRVPFGTGKGAAVIEAAGGACALPSPAAFRLLGRWLAELSSGEDADLPQRLEAILPGFPGLARLRKAIRQPAKGPRRLRRRHECFDAFWTMKWMHQVRDGPHPSLPWRAALAQADFLPALPGDLDGMQDTMEKEERRHLSGRWYRPGELGG